MWSTGGLDRRTAEPLTCLAGGGYSWLFGGGGCYRSNSLWPERLGNPVCVAPVEDGLAIDNMVWPTIHAGGRERSVERRSQTADE